MILLETRDQILTHTKEVLANFTKTNFNEITISNQDIDMIYTEELVLGETTPTNGILFHDEILTDKKAIRFTQMYEETKASLKLWNDEIRPKRNVDNHTLDNYHFKSVNVNELYVEYVNDMPINDFVFVEDGHLVLDGTVILTQPIEADIVEQIDGSENIVGDGQKRITTHISGDLTFEEINGIAWKELIDHIFMKNMANTVADLQINGVMI